MSADWYEKGELPPVGEVVSFYKNPAFSHPDGFEWKDGDEIEILAHKEVCDFPVAVVWNNSTLQARGVVLDCLRPLRTETDKLVEQAMTLFSKTESTTDAKEGIEHAVTVLIEEGYRKTKLMSEQEFMKQCVDICGHGDVRLYRSGCRFIDQGD